MGTKRQQERRELDVLQYALMLCFFDTLQISCRIF
jgi:hypothetical protein